MVEKTDSTPAQITLHYEKESARVLDPTTKLSQSYWVWALVKQQQTTGEEQYASDN